jgi:hypothetical protein
MSATQLIIFETNLDHPKGLHWVFPDVPISLAHSVLVGDFVKALTGERFRITDRTWCFGASSVVFRVYLTRSL